MKQFDMRDLMLATLETISSALTCAVLLPQGYLEQLPQGQPSFLVVQAAGISKRWFWVSCAALLVGKHSRIISLIADHANLLTINGSCK